MYTSQELTDRLCIATEEQDVVFVAVWIAEMRERGYLPQAINAKHSWKGITPLDSLVQSDFNSLRKIIMELLLLSGGDVSAKETLDVAMEAKNLEALRMMILWEKGGKEQAIDARNLLSIDLIAASDWIDFNLPQPPNSESLTGLNPLPSPPPPDSRPSESPAPSSNAERRSTTPQQPSPSSSPASAIQPQSQVCLVLDFLPRGFRPAQVQSLFDQIGVAAEIVFCDTRGKPFIARVDVPADQAQFCISNLDKMRIGDRVLSCRHIDWDSSRRHLSNVQGATPISNSASHTNFATTNGNQPRSCIRVGGLPFDYLPLQVFALFRNIGVEGIVTVCQTKVEPRFALVEVPLDQSRHCINRLHGKDLSGGTITCSYGARPSAGPYRSLLPVPPSGSSLILSPSPTFDSSPASGSSISSILPGSTSTSTPSLAPPLALPVLHYPPSHLDRQPREHNLLVLNLHLSNSSVTSDILPKLPNYTLFSYSPTQSVAFIKARSAEEAKKLKNAWDRFVIGGQQLRVVDAKDEVTPEEAVKDYFGTYLDKIQSIEEKHEVEVGEGTARKKARLSE